MRAVVLTLALLVAHLWPSPAMAERRVALVIGNGAYKSTIALPNAPTDARAMAAALRRIGFEVVDGLDLTQAGMSDKLKEFSRALVGADAALFFYAGHGLQVGGENYLVGVDAALKRESDLEFEAMKVELVMRQMQRETKVKIVILDACRDNPLARELTRSMAGGNTGARTRSAGVASGMGAIDTSGATGTLIAFATAPGAVALDGSGANSPFTEALLAHIETPDIDVDVMMKRVRGQVTRATNERQQPWTNSSLTAEFFLNTGRQSVGQASQIAAAAPAAPARPQLAALAGELAKAPAGAQAAPQSGQQPAGAPRGTQVSPTEAWQQELALWEEAKRTNQTRDYLAYLESYPSGTFAAIARNRIEMASAAAAVAASATAPRSAPPASGPEIEQRLHLGSREWREVQTRLTALGFDTRGADGNVGAGTRRALQDWQRARRYPATGYLDETQHVALLDERLPERKKAKAQDDDEEETKPTKRSRSVARPSSDSERGERRTTSQSSGTRQSQGSGSQQQESSGASTGVGVLLGVAAGVAIGRAVTRRNNR
jgi:uncharacterized caspase-like protein